VLDQFSEAHVTDITRFSLIGEHWVRPVAVTVRLTSPFAIDLATMAARLAGLRDMGEAVERTVEGIANHVSGVQAHTP
jgi:hypothetical protein